MHPLQNGSQTAEKPPTNNPIGEGGYFTESGSDGRPSYPGADYFNAQIEEFKTLLVAGNVEFNSVKFNHIVTAIKTICRGISQITEYNPERTYLMGEVCFTKTGNEITYWQWYSNTESLAGKDPLDISNRRPGWTDIKKPYYWKPFTGKIAGESMSWDTETIPENMVVGMGQQLPVAVYHSLAKAKPEWIDEIDNSLINIPDRQGRFSRAANGETWLAGETHEDQNKEHSHRIGGAVADTSNGTYPNNIFASATNGTPPFNSNYDQESNSSGGSEAMPKGYIEWKGYAL